MTKKQVLFVVLKLLFAAGVVAWLLRRMDATRVRDTLLAANPIDILVAIPLCWLGVMLAGWRWYRLLLALGIEIPLRDLLCIAQIGQFFLLFLPGPAGDDVTRMVYLARLAKERVATACTAVVLDRFIGLASILLLALLCLPMQWDLLGKTAETRLLARMMLAGGATVAIAATVFFLIRRARVRNWVARAQARVQKLRSARELLDVVVALVGHRRAVAKVGAAAVGIQIILCGVYYLAGRAVAVDVSPLLWLSFVPIVLVANAVPITVAGFGVREYLFVLFLGSLARVETERALAASLIVLGITLVVCLLGGVVYIFYRPHQAPDQVPANVPTNTSRVANL